MVQLCCWLHLSLATHLHYYLDNIELSFRDLSLEIIVHKGSLVYPDVVEFKLTGYSVGLAVKVTIQSINCTLGPQEIPKQILGKK